MSVMEKFSSFTILVFFTILVSPGPKNTSLVRNSICWNISFCDSYNEEMPKTGISFEIPRICNSLFSKKQDSIFSSWSQSKAFYLYKGMPYKNLFLFPASES